MTAVALWFIASGLAGLVVGRAISAGRQEQSACSQNCRQGRGCTCRAPFAETPP